MSHNLSRREFLKLSSLFLLSLRLPGFIAQPTRLAREGNTPNILFILFDSLSAMNIPLSGYPRNTTPNLARIAQRATTYHNHFAGGSWTYPGTASLLTGVLPWTHKAFSEGNRIVSPFKEKNLFNYFADYYRISYTHNPMAQKILKQISDSLDSYQPIQSLFANNNSLLDFFRSKDFDMATLGWKRILNNRETGYASSLFLSSFYGNYQEKILNSYLDQFPKGPARIDQDNIFLLSDATDWIQAQTQDLPQPYLAYFHLLPPHAPYSPHREFVGAFANDGFDPIEKPSHFLQNRGDLSNSNFAIFRMAYDEFVLNVDAEIGRLYDYMDTNGVLENTWVIITSDHGEMFERGILGHREPTLHQPVIRVPLMILEPGNNTRRDVFSPTVAVDLLPTLLHATGQNIPEYLEGEVLPPFLGEQERSDRSIFAVDSQRRQKIAGRSLSVSTTMLVKGKYKLVQYIGYEELPDGVPLIELFDLEDDPEELNDLYSEGSSLSAELKDELLEKIWEKDQPTA